MRIVYVASIILRGSAGWSTPLRREAAEKARRQMGPTHHSRAGMNIINYRKFSRNPRGALTETAAEISEPTLHAAYTQGTNILLPNHARPGKESGSKDVQTTRQTWLSTPPTPNWPARHSRQKSCREVHQCWKKVDEYV